MSEANIPEVSVVLACLNEDQTVGLCVEKALAAFESSGVQGEVIVSDNGSTDESVRLATLAGAHVVHEPHRGYGSAYLRGIAAAQAPIIIMSDADDTYDLKEISRLLSKMYEGHDMVLGSRMDGTILPGSMPWLHRHLGNPILTGLLNWLFKMNVRDAHTGLRAFTRDAYEKLRLRTTGMEFASEMVISAGQARLRIGEVPITYYPRRGTSKLHTWRDGWRHLRYLLLRSPRHVFLLPGIAMTIVGWLPLAMLASGPLTIGQFFFDFHYMIAGSAVAILGVQLVTLGIHGKTYLIANKLEQPDGLMNLVQRHFTLERGLLCGIVFIVLGLTVGMQIIRIWAQHGFENIFELRSGLVALTLSVSGTQLMFASFFLSLLQIETRDD